MRGLHESSPFQLSFGIGIALLTVSSRQVSAHDTGRRHGTGEEETQHDGAMAVLVLDVARSGASPEPSRPARP